MVLEIGPQKASGTRIHRGDEDDAGGKLIEPSAGGGNVAVFQRLAHNLENVAPEFRQFIAQGKEHRYSTNREAVFGAEGLSPTTVMRIMR